MRKFFTMILNFFRNEKAVAAKIALPIAAEVELDYKKKLLALCQADLEKSGKK